MGILLSPMLWLEVSQRDSDRGGLAHAKYGLARNALMASTPSITKTHTLTVVSVVCPTQAIGELRFAPRSHNGSVSPQ